MLELLGDYDATGAGDDGDGGQTSRWSRGLRIDFDR